MKKVILSLLLLGVTFVVISFAMAQSPAPSVAAVSVEASPSFFSFVKAHLAQIALAVYAILDVIILAIPSLAGNGLVHQILIGLAKLAGQTPPQS